MSDQLKLQDGSTVNVSDIDPAIAAHFAEKTKGLESKRDELLESVASLKTFKKAIDDVGGLEALRALQSQASEARTKAEQERLAKLSETDRLGEIEANYRREIEARDQRLAKWQQAAIEREVQSRLDAAIRADDGVPELLSASMRSRIEASLDDSGEVKLVVKGANGQNLDAQGNAYTLKTLVAEFKANDVYAGGFKAAGSSGAGGRKAGAGGATNNPFAEGTANVTKQMELIKAQPELARTLAAAAGVKVTW